MFLDVGVPNLIPTHVSKEPTATLVQSNRIYRAVFLEKPSYAFR